MGRAGRVPFAFVGRMAESPAARSLLDSIASFSRRNSRSGGFLMLNSKAFDDLAARIGQAIENSPAKDIEQNVKAMLSSGLARLDVVPRAEFELQAQVLLKTREKLEALEARLADIEKRLPPLKTE
jgi:BMFP domain-containing protein YqiC